MKRKIGVRLIIEIGLLVCFVSMLLTGISYVKVSGIIHDMTYDSLVSEAENTENRFENFMKLKMEKLELLARNEVVKSMDWEKIDPLLEGELKNFGVSGFQLSEPSGLTRALGGGQFDLSDKPNFINTIANNETVLTSPLYSEDDGKLIIVITTPVHDTTGKIVGVLGAVMDAIEFNDIVAMQKETELSASTLIDGNGKVIASRNINEVLEGINYIDMYDGKEDYTDFVHMIKEMTGGKKGFEEVYYSGENYYVAYQPLVGTSWSIGSFTPVKETENELRQLRNIMIAIMVVFVIIGVVIAVMIANSIKKPLMKIRKFSTELASGNLIYKIEMNRIDEFGVIGDALNDMAAEFRSILGDVIHSAESLVEATGSLDIITDESLKSIQEVSQTMEQMAITADLQAKDTEDGASVVDGLTHKLDLLYNSISSMQKLSDKALKENNVGHDAVVGMIEKTETTTAQVKQVHNIVEHVDTSVVQIDSMTKAIENIAEQTNLLALNAAIESARAGEAGRGFAVVSEEIRKLAEESSKAAREIQELIANIQEQSKIAVESMIDTESKVEEQSESVSQVRDIFMSLSGAIDEMIKQIVTSYEINESIIEGKNHLIEMISSISAISEETAASAEEVSAATEQQSAGMVEVTGHTKALNQTAQYLKQDVEKFTIK